MRVLCIVPVLVIHPPVESTVWVCAIKVFKKLIPRGEGFVRVVCIVPHVNYTPHSGKHDVGGGTHDCVRYNVHLAERFLCSNKLIFIHPTTNLYGAKNFSAHLDH